MSKETKKLRQKLVPERQIHRDLVWLKQKFLDEHGHPLPGTEPDAIELIHRLETELNEEERKAQLKKAPLASGRLTLDQMLKSYPELRDKLTEAMQTEHFLVTVHCQLVKPGVPGDLQHYLFQCAYPPGDIVSSLKHIATVHAAKMSPAADVSGAKGWV